MSDNNEIGLLAAATLGIGATGGIPDAALAAAGHGKIAFTRAGVISVTVGAVEDSL